MVVTQLKNLQSFLNPTSSPPPPTLSGTNITEDSFNTTFVNFLFLDFIVVIFSQFLFLFCIGPLPQPPYMAIFIFALE